MFGVSIPAYALIVRGIPENGKDREEIHHILATLEMTDEFNQTPQPTRLGKQNERGTSRPIKIECDTVLGGAGR